MTAGAAEEPWTCGLLEEKAKEGVQRIHDITTTLSTVAVQTAQSLMVISVLQSGVRVHLQLVHMHPGLCEIGSNREHNLTLIQDHERLMEKLKKHQPDVLVAVREQSRRREVEIGQEVRAAMEASLREAWLLLLHLLDGRGGLLTLARAFYCLTTELGSSLDQAEALQHDPSGVPLAWDSARRGLLEKSLQLLTSSGVLLQKLRELQLTEDLQRRGGVLQDGGSKIPESPLSHRHPDPAVRVQELVETLQDRRRKVDWALRPQMERAGANICTSAEARLDGAEHGWNISRGSEVVDISEEERSNMDGSERVSGSEDKNGWNNENRYQGMQSGTGGSEDEDGSEAVGGSEDKHSGVNSSEDDVGSEEEPSGMGSSEEEDGSEAVGGSEEEDGSEAVGSSEEEDGSEAVGGSEEEDGSEAVGSSEEEDGSEAVGGSEEEDGSEAVGGSEEEQNGGNSSEDDFGSEEEQSGTDGSEAVGGSVDKHSGVNGSEEEQNGGNSSEDDVGSEEEPSGMSGSEAVDGSEDQEGQLDVDGSCTVTESRSDPTSPEEASLDLSTAAEENPRHRSDSQLDLKPEGGNGTRSLKNRNKDLQPVVWSDPEPGCDPGSASTPPSLITQLKSKSAFRILSTTFRQAKTSEVHLDPCDRGWDSDAEDTSVVQPSWRSELTDQQRASLLDSKLGRASSQPTSTSVAMVDLVMAPESRAEDRWAPGSRVKTNHSAEKATPGPDHNTEGEEPAHPQAEPLDWGARSAEERDLRWASDGVTEEPGQASAMSCSSLPGPPPEHPGAREKSGPLPGGRREAGPPATRGGPQSEVMAPSRHAEGHRRKEGSAVSSDAGEQSMMGSRCQSGREEAGLRPEFLSSSEDPAGQGWSRCLSDAALQLPVAEHALNTHLLLRTQAEATASGAENMQQVLVQLRAPPVVAPTHQADALMNSELDRRVAAVLKELASLEASIGSNLRLLQPFVAFLRKTRQVELEMTDSSDRSEPRETTVRDVAQSISTAIHLGRRFLELVTMSEPPGLNVQSVVAAVQRALVWLHAVNREGPRLRGGGASDHSGRDASLAVTLQRRLHKNLRDLKSVSKLLNSCTLMDLGSEMQTSTLQEHFIRAGPLFSKLSSEVALVLKDWRGLGGTQARVEGGVSELLQRHLAVTQKIQQCEVILQLARRFHLAAAQLDRLLQDEPALMVSGSGFSGTEEPQSNLKHHHQQEIRHLLMTLSSLKRDIISAVSRNDWTCFSLNQLDARLVSLDSACICWLKEARRCEQEQRELLTQLLKSEIMQLQHSFTEVKKRFSDLKFSCVKRSRSEKEVWNQLQQVQIYEDQLQGLRQRLPGLAARPGSETKDGAAAREAEDAINVLQREAGDLERSISCHRETLETMGRLQRAVSRYQSWCEEASETITRVSRLSSRSGRSESVSALRRQLEESVRPMVPQLEERVAQITQLAVRLHGAEEGRLYVHKTVDKHAHVLRSIRELSHMLLLLEDSLRPEQEEVEEERRGKHEQRDNRHAEDAEDAEDAELKETGHTPELPLSWKRPPAAGRRPPLHKSRGVEGERRKEGSLKLLSSTHVFGLSCSPVADGRRRVHAIHGPPGRVATELHVTASLIPPMQREVQTGSESPRPRRVGGCDVRVWGAAASSVSHLASAEDLAVLRDEGMVSDDSRSSDEYECVSPDDISLPPMAETPESLAVQSDVEEGACCSSRVHSSPAVTASSHACEDAGPEQLPGTAASTLASSSTVSPSGPEKQTWRGDPRGLTGPDPHNPRKSSALCESKALVPGGQRAAEKKELSQEADTQTALLSSIRLSPRDLQARGRRCTSVRDRRPHLQGHCPSRPEGSDKPEPGMAPQRWSNAGVRTVSNLSGAGNTRSSPPLSSSEQRHDWMRVEVSSLRDASAQRPFHEVTSQTSAELLDATVTVSVGALHPSLGRTIAQALSAHEEEPRPRTFRGPPPQAVLSSQQRVHDPNMALTDAAPPEAHDRAFAESANLHVPPPSQHAPPLTPDEDADVCRPLAVREEIRLTSQIQGPALPAVQHAQKRREERQSGPPGFTRPVSGAAVMEGSPVELELELEVADDREPALTWLQTPDPAVGAHLESGFQTTSTTGPLPEPDPSSGCHGCGLDTWTSSSLLKCCSPDPAETRELRFSSGRCETTHKPGAVAQKVLCEDEGAPADVEGSDVRGDPGREDEGRRAPDQVCELIAADWLTWSGIMGLLLWLLHLLLL